jgi:hypothetical protein
MGSKACHQGCTEPFTECGKWALSLDQRDAALSHASPNNIGLLHVAAQTMSKSVYLHAARQAVRYVISVAVRTSGDRC